MPTITIEEKSRPEFLLAPLSTPIYPQPWLGIQEALNLLKIIQKEENPSGLLSQQFLLQKKTVLFLWQEEFGDGEWDYINKIVVPKEKKLVCIEWKNTAMKIYKTLNLPCLEMDNPSIGMTKEDWVNTSSSVENLLADAQKVSLFFIQLCQKIEVEHSEDCFLSLGPDNLHMIKNERSIRNKIKKYDSIAKIGDVLRSTLITNGLRPIPSIVKSVIKEVRKHGGQLYIKDLWKKIAHTKDEFLLTGLGYGGVHFRIRMPFFAIEANRSEALPALANQTAMPQQNKYLQMEIQIHPKEISEISRITHPIYKKKAFTAELSSASKLLYLMGMKGLLEEYQKGFSRQKIIAEEILRKLNDTNLISDKMDIKNSA